MVEIFTSFETEKEKQLSDHKPSYPYCYTFLSLKNGPGFAEAVLPCKTSVKMADSPGHLSVGRSLGFMKLPLI